jgi:hypothetical protein
VPARPGWTLRELYALAWLDGLERRTPQPPSGPQTRLRLDDTGRPPYVPLSAPLRPARQRTKGDYA